MAKENEALNVKKTHLKSYSLHGVPGCQMPKLCKGLCYEIAEPLKWDVG